MKIVLATNNRGKVTEIKAILDKHSVEVLSLADIPGAPPLVVEDAGTFAGNAALKARAVAAWAGMPALADDSGLVVKALGGQPGVHSSRYAGQDGDSEANMALLLERMAHVPESGRMAHFACVMVLAAPDGRTWEAGGRVDGLITFQKRGLKGFGYDPVFFYIPADRTFAEMTVEEKNRVSHRFRALEALAKMWEEIERKLRKSSEQ
ncbi:MAG: XTP/dITP diphosphatase [bacterium]|nr:XTP/dITP diphosphatase [bacterium]MDT8396082.1 XTP/dITP diphosphatase [bacterium]